MSKTAERVAIDILDQRTNLSAELVVSALREAGWLREANEIPALVALEGYKRLLAEKERELAEAKSQAMTPAVARVVEAARKWLKFYYTNGLVWSDGKELAAAIAAVDALTPAPEPRWTTERWPLTSSKGEWGVNKGNKWHGPYNSPELCYAVAAALNAEARTSPHRQPTEER